jgi:DNA-binding response OmpR family regulator
VGVPQPLILICDDEPALRELIRVSLGPDFRYSEAATVADSIKQLEREPDVVVLDLMLPGGSGLDVLRAIHAAGGGRPAVLVVSAWSDEGNREAAERAGADGFLPKPFSPTQLAARVDELLATGGS